MTRTAFLRGTQVKLLGLSDEERLQAALWADDRRVAEHLERGALPADPSCYPPRRKDDEAEFGVWVGGDFVGVTGLHKIRHVHRKAEFRALIGDRNYWGKGVGTEVARLMIAYGFEVLNLRKLWLGVWADNERAVSAYRRAGFEEEGVLLYDVYGNGAYHDVRRMAVFVDGYHRLRDEAWPAELREVLAAQFPRGDHGS